MPTADYYKRKLAEMENHLIEAQALIEGIKLRMADRAVLLSITRDGRKNRFLFERNGKLTSIETMGTWDDDIQAWQKALLHRQDG